MRDAFGGVFTMNILLVFIFIFVAFTAVSLNYAKAFKIKNNVIDFLEENEISGLNEAYIGNKIEELAPILTNSNYSKTCEQLGDLINLDLHQGEYREEDRLKGYCYNGIYIGILESTPIEGTSSKMIKYNVVTAADWNLGALNKLLALAGKKENSENYIMGSWTITGEAKVITK